MDCLISRLNQIPESYYEFIDTVIDYAEAKDEHMKLLLDFLADNDMATVSDVLHLISIQPDFFDDEYLEDEMLVG